MINKEAIQRVLSVYTKGVHTRDTRLTKRHVYNKLLTVRNMLLEQKANKRQAISNEAYQVLPCVKMSLAPVSDCSCVPAFLLENCKLYKSESKIPHILKSIHGILLRNITTIDGQVSLDYYNYANLRYLKGRKFGQEKPFVFIFNDYLYQIKSEYELLQIEAVFIYPLEADKFKECDCDEFTDCESYQDKIFPIPSTLEEILIDISKNELIGLFQHGKVDIPNSMDNSVTKQQEE